MIVGTERWWTDRRQFWNRKEYCWDTRQRRSYCGNSGSRQEWDFVETAERIKAWVGFTDRSLLDPLIDRSPLSSAFCFKVDVRDWDQQVELFKFAIEKLNRIDYVFANAGIRETPFLEYTSPKQVKFVKPDLKAIEVNLVGALYTSNLAAQIFRTQRVVDGFRGKIIFTASVAYSLSHCL